MTNVSKSICHVSPTANSQFCRFSLMHLRILYWAKNCGQGVTNRCRKSWLTNSALIYEPKSGGGESLSQWVQLNTGAQINFGDLTPYLTYGYNNAFTYDVLGYNCGRWNVARGSTSDPQNKCFTNFAGVPFKRISKILILWRQLEQQTATPMNRALVPPDTFIKRQVTACPGQSCRARWPNYSTRSSRVLTRLEKPRLQIRAQPSHENILLHRTDYLRKSLAICLLCGSQVTKRLPRRR